MSLDNMLELFQKHQILAIALVVVFGILVYKKPKPMFQLMGAVLIIGAIGYVVSILVDLTSPGIDHTTAFTSNPSR
jgi:xanthine/uracil permease